MTRRYKAFISYSWGDKDWGQWLHRALETYRAPAGVAEGQTLHPIFKDREEEAAGGSVGAAIEAALGASEYLIVICSPRSAQSTWVNREIAWFKTHKDKANILALIVDGEPGASSMPGREAEECFPKTLTRKVSADLQPTDDWEDAPLAADARTEGDGKRGAKLKLAAALLGVGLDALVRRDERRRTVRRRFVTSAALALSAAMSVLAFVAANQRDAAVKAQALAQAAQEDAEFQRDEAQDLTEFMLTDLRQRLDAVGRLDILEMVGARLNESFDKQDLSKLDPDALGRRARVQLLLGEVDNKRGNIDAAFEQYRKAAATTEELLNRDPENPQRMFDHAQSVFWVGYIAWQRGDRAAAKRQFTEYHDFAQKLVAKDPANEDWQAELDYAYSNLGTLAMDDGEAAEAEGYFRKSLELALARLKSVPADADRVWAAGQAYAWLADALHRQTRLYDELSIRRGEFTMYETAVQNGANNSQIGSALSVSTYRLAEVYLSLGDLDEALKYAKAASDSSQKMLDEDPSNTDQIDRTAVAKAVLAEVEFWSGHYVQARLAAKASGQHAAALISMDSKVSKWKAHIRPELLNARLHLKLGAKIQSKPDLRPLIAALNEDFISAQHDPQIRTRYCSILAGRARLEDTTEDSWKKILLILHFEPDKLGPEGLALLAEAAARSNSLPQSREIAVRLLSAGYRHPGFLALLEEFPDLRPTSSR